MWHHESAPGRAGATDAARGAADIVLTRPGLSVIVSAIIGARKIFQRMTTYSKYTVAMTFRVCFTFGLLTVIYNWCALPGRPLPLCIALSPVPGPPRAVVLACDGMPYMLREACACCMMCVAAPCGSTAASGAVSCPGVLQLPAGAHCCAAVG